MANNGLVFTERKLTYVEVGKTIQEILDKSFYGLVEVLIEDDYICIHSPIISNFNSIMISISDNIEYGEVIDEKYVEYVEPKVISKQSVIQIRHGHGSCFFTWLDYFINASLGFHYDCLVGDEGYEQRDKADEKQLQSFYEYLETPMFSNFEWSISKDQNYLREDMSNENTIKNFYNEIEKRKRGNKLKTIL